MPSTTPTSPSQGVSASVATALNPGRPREVKILGGLALAVGLCFIIPLFRLIRFAAASDLYSHILLIPFISAYLIHLRLKESTGSLIVTGRNRGYAVIFIVLGASLLIGYRFALTSGWKLAAADYLSIFSAAALSFFYAASFVFLDASVLKQFAFPLAFLIFAVPFPDSVYHAIETFLQYRSADAAYSLFNLTGMPVLRSGTEFKLPGFSLAVAPECSGIHSSLVLFISSLLAAHMLLRSNWSRSIFVLFIIPLGIIRNGFRIWVLGELCVQYSHDWINSELHHRGGPIFFILSLIPLFALLFVLRKLENRKTRLTAP